MEDEHEQLWETPLDVLREIVGEVFDGYDEAVENLDGEVAQTERGVFDGKPRVSRRIHALTRVVVEMHQAIEPLADALDHFLESADVEARKTLSQSRHRIRRVTEKLDGFRDLLSSLLSVNLTMVGQKISAVSEFSRLAWAHLKAVEAISPPREPCAAKAQGCVGSRPVASCTVSHVS